MDRSQLINKWFNELNMSIQTDAIKEKFCAMISCLSDTELARPFFVMENTKKGTPAIASRYKVGRAVVRHQIKVAKQQPPFRIGDA